MREIMIRKIKNFIHKYESLEKVALSFWGIFYADSSTTNL